MTDRHAVIWTRAPKGVPVKMGSLVATGTESRFTYSQEFLDSNYPAGLSLLASPGLYKSEPFVHRNTEIQPLPPRLLAKIPPQRANNIQRRVYAALLAKRPNPPAPGFDTDWELLMLAGHNGIGHLDVFRDDIEASKWYEAGISRLSFDGQRSQLWSLLKQDLNLGPDEADANLAALIGPTPSVGGMIPKLLVATPNTDDWDGRIAASGTQAIKGTPYIDVVMKIEPPDYTGIVELESLCLQWHASVGFSVPRFRTTEVDGLPVLAVARFDRDKNGIPIPLESFYSVMATGAADITGATDTDMERVGGMLAALPQVINIDLKAAQVDVYRRFCAAILTGNGDLHLENLSFLGGPDNAQVAPVYDPTPMRAWAKHDLMAAIPFEIEGGIGKSLVTLGAAFGLSKTDAANHFHELRDKAKELDEQVMALKRVPLVTRKRLVGVLKDIRKRTAI